MKTRLPDALRGILLLIVLACAVLAGYAATTDVYVNATFTTSTTGWGTDHFADIQSGVNGVDVGGTVHIAAGAYAGPVSVNKILTLSGDDMATTSITKTLTLSAQPGSGRMIVQNISVISTGGATNYHGIIIDASAGNTAPVTLQNVTATGSNSTLNVDAAGLVYKPAGHIINDTLLLGCHFDNSGTRGLYILPDAGTVTNLVANNCTFDHNCTKPDNGQNGFGLYIMKSYGGVVVDGVSFTNCTFNNEPYKGIYAEALSNALFTGITVINSGTNTSSAGKVGIDINVKYGTYANLTFTNFAMTNSGASTGAGIAIKGRNDASYAAHPASLSNVTITNGFISGCPYGLSIGNNVTAISVHSCSLTANTLAGLLNWTDAAAIDATNNWWGTIQGPSVATNPGGNGGVIAGTITFSPWLGDGTDTKPASVGFQPNLTPLNYTPVSLAFAPQPGGALLNAPLAPQPAVQVMDANGGVATQFQGQVSLAIGANPSAGILNGTSTSTLVNGIATFTDLAISQAGAGYTLVASTTGLSSQTSNAFDVSNPVPSLTSISPSAKLRGSATFILTVNGTNFVSTSIVRWNGTNLPTSYGSSNQLSATVDQSLVAATGIANITVVSPSPGGGTTSAQSLTVVGDVLTFTGTPAITGNALVGKVLSLTDTGSFDLNNNSVTLSYQWRANETNMPGATAATLALLTAQAHAAITCVITADDGNGATATATTAPVTVGNTTPAFTGTPAISGPPLVNNTLSLSSLGTNDADNDVVTLSYQWQAGGINIPGATTATLALLTAQAHASITCVITADDGYGGSATVTTPPVTVDNTTPAFVSSPSITGIAKVGQTLGLSSTGTSDVDGDAVTMTYQWQAGGVDITGATAATLPLTSDQAHSSITCNITAHDGHGGTATSSTDTVMVLNSAPTFPHPPAISGIVAVGNTVSLANATATDVDGDKLTLSYCWQVNGTVLTNAATDSLLLTTAQAHTTISCTLTADDGLGGTTSVTTTAVPVANTAPIFTGAPVIAGVAIIGNTLLVSNPGTSDADGDAVTLRCQWLANGKAIPNAIAATLKLSTAQAGANISCALTLNDSHGGITTVVTAALPVYSVTLAATPSPASLDASITLSATLLGRQSAQYQFIVNGKTLAPYAPLSTYTTWQPKTAGSYTLAVSAKDDANLVTVSPNVLLTIAPPLRKVTLTTSATTPLFNGQQIILHATADAGVQVVYQFFADGGALGSFSPTSSANWTPTSSGAHTLSVTAKDLSGDPARTVAASATITTLAPLSAVQCVAKPATPVALHVPVVFQATSTGGISIQYQFSIMLQGAAGPVPVVQSYRPLTNYTWIPMQPGTYTITVAAREAYPKATPSVVSTTLTFTIMPVLSSVAFQGMNGTITRPTGSALTLTAAATGGANLVYQFTAAGKVVQGYLPTPTCTLNVPAGSTKVTVSVKDLSSANPAAVTTSAPLTIVGQ